LETVVAVRDTAIKAYNSIMQMSIWFFLYKLSFLKCRTNLKVYVMPRRMKYGVQASP
jgi:hypothetical protein